MKQISILLALCTLSALHVRAQKDADTVTPYREGTSYMVLATAELESEEAISEAQHNTKLAGFSEAYFSGATISEILRNPKVVGIRFYNAYEPDFKAFTVVAVAIREDGSELSSGSSRKYLISTPNNKTELHWKGYARTCVELCRDVEGIKHYSALFSKSVINKMMEESGDGIKLIPASRKFETKDKSVKTYNTMMAAGASVTKGSLQVPGNSYQKSLVPCPYNCPTDRFLLAPAEY